MMLQLAEKYYDMPDLFENLVQSHSAISVTQNDHNFTIKAPENLKPDETIMIRPKEVDLMSQLETGELDYLIIYRSVVYQHRNSGVDFLILPDDIDLSNPSLATDYDNVSLLQYSDKPDKGKIITARPVVYGITIPTNAEHTNEAEKFIEMLLGDIGQEIFNDNGQPPITPARANDINKLPDRLKNLVDQL
jgi:molybdate/tungstate transport system substrate-binding protein